MIKTDGGYYISLDALTRGQEIMKKGFNDDE
jgi:hypothetical protein